MLNEKRIPKTATASRRKNERGVILLLGTLSMPVLVSMMGLGIDASIVYNLRSRLQLAVDGSALAAARALSVGMTTSAQATSARNNATNWFNKNFPAGEFGSSNTVLAEPQVFDDPLEPLVRHVVVQVASDAPSYFMRFWGREGTRVGASSRASRRDSVIMMVLDRSGSMNTGGTNDACTLMKAAAKQFTGMFAPSRDMIGMVTYSDTMFLASPPTQNFRTVLGYHESSTSNGPGLIDNISCGSTTGTAGATILGYNELYKVGLPGALNVLLVFTDGVPNTMVIDGNGGVNQQRGIFLDTLQCQDANLNRIDTAATTPGDFGANPPQWSPAIGMGTNNFFQADNIHNPSRVTGANLVAGPHLSVSNHSTWYKFWSTSSSDTGSAWVDSKGCGGGRVFDNMEWIPERDVFGTALDNTAYRPLARATLDGASRIRPTTDNWNRASFNSSANAASRARTTRNLWDSRVFPGVFVYVIGLGAVNHGLLQRMANDPTPDPGGAYTAFSGIDTTQPVGSYVYAQDSTRLSEAFARIASFILRLSQ